jgi:hypothetical protein
MLQFSPVRHRAHKYESTTSLSVPCDPALHGVFGNRNAQQKHIDIAVMSNENFCLPSHDRRGIVTVGASEDEGCILNAVPGCSGIGVSQPGV